MIIKITDVNNAQYQIQEPKTDLKTIVDSISNGNGFLEVEFKKNQEVITTFLAVDKIVTIREISAGELKDIEYIKSLKF